MKASCPRLFEVEALRDGRLDGAQAVSFRSHLAVCSVCMSETRALQALAEALRSATHSADADELHLRRERTRLLSAFDASLVPASRNLARLWLRSAAVVAALSALIVLAFVFRRPHPAPSESDRADRGGIQDAVTIHADGHARWSRHVEARLEKVILENGTLTIRVDRTTSPRRLLVVLPDGELEDIGTTFSVRADAGRTTHVKVQDGSVVLRLHGRPAILIGAGDSWPSPSSPAAAPPNSTPPTPAIHSAQSSPSVPPASKRSTSDTAPNAAFRAAMAAFEGGDHVRAAAGFSAFVRQHPGDPRAEDAAYLRILALQRAGDPSAMKQAVHDYLSRFPRGFRHTEVERLLQ